ncbi:MAG TPA: Nif11 family protein [Pyrinomonadaceae bacterium]|jgi:hypothetical protein
MSQENLEQFRRLVCADADLRARLLGETDEAAFVALAVAAGAERGCEFTAEEARAAMQAARRAWVERWIQ